jgi:transposase InsO family protein
VSSVQRDPSGFRRQGYGTEFTSNAVLHWSKERQVELHYIAPGEPMQNGYIESFNGRMRDELLNESRCNANAQSFVED